MRTTTIQELIKSSLMVLGEGGGCNRSSFTDVGLVDVVVVFSQTSGRVVSTLFKKESFQLGVFYQ